MSKIHHVVIDGMSGAEIIGALYDLTPEPREPPPANLGVEGEERPGELEMLARGALGFPRYPLRLLRSVPRVLPNIEEVPSLSGIPGLKTAGRIAGAAQRVLGGHKVVGHRNLAPPRTLFNGRVSPYRRYAFGQLSLAEVKEVKNEHGCTVNDMVVSVCAGAVRRWLLEHVDLPEDPLVAQVPISVRREEEAGTYGNRILLMTAPFFTKIADPVERLHDTHEALVEMKDCHKALPEGLLQDANHFIPPAGCASRSGSCGRLASLLTRP